MFFNTSIIKTLMTARVQVTAPYYEAISLDKNKIFR